MPFETDGTFAASQVAVNARLFEHDDAEVITKGSDVQYGVWEARLAPGSNIRLVQAGWAQLHRCFAPVSKPVWLLAM